MKALIESTRRLDDPTDYFKGVGEEPIPTPKQVILFLRANRTTLQQKALQNRSHHRFVLIFNLETKGMVHVDNRMIPLRPGESLLIFPFQFHHYTALASPKLLWMFCTFELESPSFLEPLRNRAMVMTDDVRHDLEKLLRYWHGRKRDLGGQCVQIALNQLLLTLKQVRQRADWGATPEPKDQLLLRVNRILAESRGQTLVTDDLSESIGYSGSRLRTLFRKTAGIPIGRYIQNFRMNRAMSLLRNSDLPISTIAEESGFGSPQAFSRIFRIKTGQTPREYRRK